MLLRQSHSAGHGYASARALAVTLALGLALGGGAVHAATVHTPHWLRVQARSHRATLTLIAAYTGALGGFNFNGHGRGTMVVSVPVGYHIKVVFSNRSLVPHSAVVVPFSQRNAQSGYRPAFRGASSPNPLSGTTAGRVQTFSFIAARAGTYAIVCAVPGHEMAGMWDVLKVTKGGRASLTLKR